MYATPRKIRNVTFFVLVAIFAVLVAPFLLPVRLAGFASSMMLALGIVFGLLGLVLAVLTLRLQEARIQKTLFMVAGASAAGIPICAILHNVVYGLFILWFGKGFWATHGNDEPVFFLLAVVVCPALFLVASAGSIVLLIKARMAKQGQTP